MRKHAFRRASSGHSCKGSSCVARSAVPKSKTAETPLCRKDSCSADVNSDSVFHQAPEQREAVARFKHSPQHQARRWSRRDVASGALLVVGGGALPAAAAGDSWIPDLVKRQGADRPLPKLDPELAPLFTRAVYEANNSLKIMSEAEFQAANFKLRDREYKYYYEANKDRMPRIPDLSDMSGGLSNPVYFNFVYYITWKVLARRVTGDAARSELNREVGKQMVNLIAPGPAAACETSREVNGGGVARVRDVQHAVEDVLADLQRRGYLERAQVVWGATNSNVPYEWENDLQPSVRVTEDDAQSLASFQVRLRRPADIEGSVSLRSEEDGFWSRAVSSMLVELLRRGGFDGAADEYFLQDQWEPPAGLRAKLLLLLGDPLMEVEVPWKPESLIQDWKVVPAPRA